MDLCLILTMALSFFIHHCDPETLHPHNNSLSACNSTPFTHHATNTPSIYGSEPLIVPLPPSSFTGCVVSYSF